jgi:hypothetical protein
MDSAENIVLLLRSADQTENTSHVIGTQLVAMTSLYLRGCVFTEKLPRNGFHYPFLLLCFGPFLPGRCLTIY